MNNDPSDRRLLVFADPSGAGSGGGRGGDPPDHRRRARERHAQQSRCPAVRRRRCSTRLLADEPAFRERFPWAQTHFFFGDERHVPPDDKDSNFRMASEAMFDKLAGVLPPENIHRVYGESHDPYAAAAEYAREVDRVFRRRARGRVST